MKRLRVTNLIGRSATATLACDGEARDLLQRAGFEEGRGIVVPGFSGTPAMGREFFVYYEGPTEEGEGWFKLFRLDGDIEVPIDSGMVKKDEPLHDCGDELCFDGTRTFIREWRIFCDTVEVFELNPREELGALIA